MGEQKIQNYGEAFVTAVNSFVADNPNPSGSTTGERPQTVLSDEEAVEIGSTRKKKLPFYIEPQKLDEVELTDKCRLTELTNKINELCPADKEHKKACSLVYKRASYCRGISGGSYRRREQDKACHRKGTKRRNR